MPAVEPCLAPRRPHAEKDSFCPAGRRPREVQRERNRIPSRIFIAPLIMDPQVQFPPSIGRELRPREVSVQWSRCCKGPQSMIRVNSPEKGSLCQFPRAPRLGREVSRKRSGTLRPFAGKLERRRRVARFQARLLQTYRGQSRSDLRPPLSHAHSCRRRFKRGMQRGCGRAVAGLQAGSCRWS